MKVNALYMNTKWRSLLNSVLYTLQIKNVKHFKLYHQKMGKFNFWLFYQEHTYRNWRSMQVGSIFGPFGQRCLEIKFLWK